MSAFLAIVQDTWRQSKQQIVFIVMLVLLFVLSLALIIIPKVYPESVRVFTSAGPVEAGIEFDATQAVALGDLDNDGDLDAVLGNGAGTADRVWLNDGKAAFTEGAKLGDADTRAVVIGDLDRDGDLDVVTGGVGPEAVYLNDGKGGLTAGAKVGDATTAALALGDVDGDKDLDLVVGHAAGVAVWTNDGKGGFGSSAAVVDGDVRAVVLNDLDGDGDLDLVVVRAKDAGHGVWLNDGSGGFTAGPALGRSDGRAAVSADFDLDGRPDVLIGSAGGARQQMWLNQGEGTWKQANRYAFGYGQGGQGLLALAVGDFNGDKKPDIVGGAAAGQENPVRTNNAVKPQPIQIKTDDAAKTKKRRLAIQRGPNFVPQNPVGGAAELRAVAVGDLNNDGNDEILAVFPQKDLGFRWSDEPSEILGAYWIKLYGDTLIGKAEPEPETEETKGLPKEMQRQAAAMAKAADLAQDVPGFQRSIEAWLVIGAKAIFTLSMVLFIVACSAYFPSLLADGAVDVVLSRPVSRLHILAARFVGGLALFTAAILGTYLLVFIGIGIQTGVWHGRLFMAAPLQIYAAAVLYAILGCVGILFRSTILAVILGLFFYIAVDSGLELLLRLQTAGLLEEVPKLEAFTNAVRVSLPNFGLLKDVSTMSVLNVPSFDMQPIAVAGAWLAICLGIGYWKFRRTDY